MIQFMIEVDRAGDKRLSNIKAEPDGTTLSSLFNSVLFSHRWWIFLWSTHWFEFSLMLPQV